MPPNLCLPGGEETAKAVAEITGKKVEAVEAVIAAVRCSKTEGKVKQKYDYIGYRSCVAANIAFGGIMECKYACIGFGDCERACPFGAITIKDGMPFINPLKCVGCGTCVKACPKNVIEIIPKNARVWVPCSSKDPGKVVRSVCNVGCISCKMCIKSCPAKAISMEDGIIKIDHKKCLDYGDKCEMVCVEKCPRKILRPFEIKYEYELEKKAA